MELIKIEQPIQPVQSLPSIDEDRIRAFDTIKSAPAVLKIDGVVKLRRGNISVWKGKAKSRKTFALTLMMATMVKGERINDKFTPANQKAIGWIDTEQSPDDVWKIAKRIQKMCGTDERLLLYCLRRYNKATRRQKIERFLKEYADSIDVLVIDGIRDLVDDFNDLKESGEMVDTLMAWSLDYDIHITTVLHANKSDGKMRGHLGTELENKCEAVFAVSKEPETKNLSKVEEEMGRGKGTEPWYLEIDDEGVPQLTGNGIDDIDDDQPF